MLYGILTVPVHIRRPGKTLTCTYTLLPCSMIPSDEERIRLLCVRFTTPGNYRQVGQLCYNLPPYSCNLTDAVEIDVKANGYDTIINYFGIGLDVDQRIPHGKY